MRADHKIAVTNDARNPCGAEKRCLLDQHVVSRLLGRDNAILLLTFEYRTNKGPFREAPKVRAGGERRGERGIAPAQPAGASQEPRESPAPGQILAVPGWSATMRIG